MVQQKKKFLKGVSATALAMVAILLIAGCQTSQGSKTYTRGQAQTPMQVYYGTVLQVSDVTIESKPTGIGTGAGGVVGGVVGSTIGSGTGRVLATTAGALAGAAAGAAAEKAAGTRAGLEIEVELDDGRILVVVQEKDDVYNVGDRVRLVQSGGTMRVRQ
jgi:outer membrane lipoprotein SlyB